MKFSGRLHVLAAVCCTLAMTALTGCTPRGAIPATNTHPAPVQTTKVNGTTNNIGANSSQPTRILTKPPAPPPIIHLGAHTSLASYLNESLGLLGYLPVEFHPSHSLSLSAAMNLLRDSRDPLPGSYTWRDHASASNLEKLWNPHSFNTITEGALMRFQEDHGLQIDGAAGPAVWKALQDALHHQQVSTHPYTFITVDERPTEVLRVWVNGKVAVQTAANTGISQSPSSIGTWPIYLRYVSQEMKGTTPWGTTYDDPGVPYVSYYHGGEAVHGFPRSSYGYPQSLGCVEIPISTAQHVYSLVDYGVLVSVRI